MSAAPTVVLVHGSWHGPWCWEPITPLLQQRGLRVLAPQMPSSGPVPDPSADLSGDIAAVRASIAQAAAPVLLCGHSSGGAAIAGAAAGDQAVGGLVFLAAFMPDAGESILSLLGPDLPPWIRVDSPGLLNVDPLAAPQVFYGDCDADIVHWATPQRTLRAAAADGQILHEVGWHDRPTLCVVCTRDQAIPPDAQRTMAARAGRTVELDTHHFAQLSQPEAVADLLADAAVKMLSP